MIIRELGIRIDNLNNGLVPYTLLTIALSLGSLIFLRIFGNNLIGLWHQLYPTPLILILIAFLQELFFRSILISKLKSRFSNVFVVILLDAVIFALAHIIFPFRELLVPGAFFVGIGFATVYYYRPNFFLASISHSVLNLIIIPICYFKLASC